VFWCGQASFFLVLALYLQQGRGLSALQAGLVFTILAGAYLVASLGAPALAVRHGRRVLAAGALALASGHLGDRGRLEERLLSVVAPHLLERLHDLAFGRMGASGIE
jgi:MFS family permease